MKLFQDSRNRAALAALLTLVAVTLLYPDTFIDSGPAIAGFRVSPLPLVLVLSAPFIAAAVIAGRGSFRPRLIDAFLLASLTLMGIVGFINANTSNERGLVVAFIAYLLGVYYGTYLISSNSQVHKIIYLVLAGIGVLISAYALAEFLLARNFIYQDLIIGKIPVRSGDFHRSGSTLAQPVALGIVMVQLAPFIVNEIASASGSRWRMFWSAGLMVSLFALLTSFSKGSWITMAFLAFIFIAWSMRRIIHWKRHALIGSILLIGAMGAFIFKYEAQFSFQLTSDIRVKDSYSIRMFLWERAPQVIAAHPLAGVGLQRGGEAVFDEALTADQRKLMVQPKALDNIYVTAIVEGGIIGALLAGAALAFLVRQSVVVLRRGGEAARLALPLVFSMGATMVNGVTADSLLIWAPMVIFWLCAGLMRTLDEQEQEVTCS